MAMGLDPQIYQSCYRNVQVLWLCESYQDDQVNMSGFPSNLSRNDLPDLLPVRGRWLNGSFLCRIGFCRLKRPMIPGMMAVDPRANKGHFRFKPHGILGEPPSSIRNPKVAIDIWGNHQEWLICHKKFD